MTTVQPADAPAPALSCEIDHLVVAAATLEEGAAWCEATLGVSPGPGGKHALFGTHNRLLRIDGPGYAQAYLEIIAVDPDAPAPNRPRWFGLDQPATHRRLASHGPSLWHVVARTRSLDAQLAALRAVQLDAGEALAASRETPSGCLQWRIAVRADGALLLGGALPTLIEWGSRHPTEAMPASPIVLRELVLAGVPAEAQAALGLAQGRFVAQSGAALRATLDTPRGPVDLHSA